MYNIKIENNERSIKEFFKFIVEKNDLDYYTRTDHYNKTLVSRSYSFKKIGHCITSHVFRKENNGSKTNYYFVLLNGKAFEISIDKDQITYLRGKTKFSKKKEVSFNIMKEALNQFRLETACKSNFLQVGIDLLTTKKYDHLKKEEALLKNNIKFEN